jgi:hypothetical protein
MRKIGTAPLFGVRAPLFTIAAKPRGRVRRGRVEGARRRAHCDASFTPEPSPERR